MSWPQKRILNWFQSVVLRIIKTGEIPKHVAFIMDGNRRYANKHNLSEAEGHLKGSDKLNEMLKWSMNLGIAEVTVYAFSIENFKRNKEEVDNLIEAEIQGFVRKQDDGICIRVFGNLSLLPEDICKLIAEVMIVTRENNRIFINFAVAYTSRDEITHAIKDISNTCIYFIKVLWSEFSLWNFLCAIFYYQRCYSSLQKNKNNLKPIMHNTRVSMFIYKLYNKRDIAIEKIYQSAIQS
ncbi:DHDDS synthase, partial [Acromyrmex insinuator]